MLSIEYLQKLNKSPELQAMECKFCWKILTRKTKESKRDFKKRIFCWNVCSWNYRFSKLSENEKAKWNKSRLWKTSHFKWKTYKEIYWERDEDERIKRSISHKWEKSYSWKWWISSENEIERRSVYYYIWRRSVFKRDDFTCKSCLNKWWKIVVHHILNFSSNKDKRFDISNGITLCEKCHKEFHKHYWNRDNNLEQIKEFISLTC